MDKRLGIVALVMAVVLFGTLTLAIMRSDEPPPEMLEPLPTTASASKPGSEVPTHEAVPSTLIEHSDTSFPGRKRVRAFIAAPDALTPEQRAHTALAAAVQIATVQGADYVLVQMAFDEKGMSAGWAAEAEYAPDGFDQSGETPLRNGTWEASYSTLNPRPDVIAIFRAWDEHKESYRNDDGMLNERKLKAKISKQTGATTETIDAALLEYSFAKPLKDFP